ncbi:MAG: hypothetical protein KAY37_04880 [Phycisphaerae bacterium]|nr:hypothetical protein [Phycisphaerae bacterium]
MPLAWGHEFRMLVLLLGIAFLAGCSRTPAEPPRPSTPEIGPRETIQRIMELRGMRKYSELRGLVVPEGGHEVVTTLMAVDDFLDANRGLCNWLRDNVGMGLAQTIDQAYIGDVLGIFSRYVELLDESVTDSRARVSFTVDGKLPVMYAQLRIVDGIWRYDPESGYSEYLPAAFHEMARGLESVLADLESGRVSREDLLANPEGLLEKVAARLRQGVNLLSKAQMEVTEVGNSRPDDTVRD